MSSSQFDPYEGEIPPFPAPAVPAGPSGAMPPLGETPPTILVQQAAEGKRGAAWRLVHQIMNNDPQTIGAVATFDDDRLAQRLLEFIALGTWANKQIEMPLFLHAAHVRTRLRTLFLPGAGIQEERTLRVMRAAMQDPRPAMRENAAYILGLVGDRGSVPLLLNAMHDPSMQVRLQATKALGRIGDPSVVPSLLGSLNQAEEFLGSQVFQALIQLGTKAVPALIDACRSKEAWIRWYCMRALGKIGDDRAVPVLVRGLADSDHSVAWMAAKSLPDFDTLSIEPVLQLLTTSEISPWLLETSAFVLKEQTMRHTQLKPYLNPLLREMRLPYTTLAVPGKARAVLDDIIKDGVLRSIKPV